MSSDKMYPVPPAVAAHALINREQYETLYAQSIDDMEGFWATQAENFIDWFKKWDTVVEWDFHKAHVRWFDGAQLNVSYNCLDRHLATRGEQTAIIWEGDDPNQSKKITYNALHEEVCRFANALKARNVVKGDRVCLTPTDGNSRWEAG